MKEIFKEWEMYLTGLGIFVGLPFLASFLLGRDPNNILVELILALTLYTLLFLWVMKRGLSNRRRR